MPLNENQKKYIELFGSSLTYKELAARIESEYDTVRHYCQSNNIECKSGKKVSTISKNDISIIVANLGIKRKKEIVAMCKANANVISKWATKHNIDWKNRLGTLTEDEKLFVINNIGLKTNEITNALKAKNPNINYDVVYNFHSKQKDLNNAKEQKAVNHEIFDLKYMDNEYKFLTGPFYPYPSNIQFLQA